MECTINFLLNLVLCCTLHMFGKGKKQDNRLLAGTACFRMHYSYFWGVYWDARDTLLLEKLIK